MIEYNKINTVRKPDMIWYDMMIFFYLSLTGDVYIYISKWIAAIKGKEF